MEAPSLSPSLSPPSPSPPRTVPDLPCSSTDRARSSTETTIFTIYSMYGNDEQRASWSASHFENNSRELDLSLGDTFTYNNSFFNHSSPYPPNKDSAYLDLSTDPRPRSRLPNPHERVHLSSVSDPPVRVEYSRTPSQYAPSPVPGDNLELPSCSPRVSSGQKHPRSTATSCTSQTDSVVISPPLRLKPLPTPPHSRPPSSLIRSDSPLPDPLLTSQPPNPSSSLFPPQSTQTPSSTPTTRQQSRLSPPSSKTSLVPSEGEDLDSFHVRRTYAQLDATGVKGDGYEDGVERTRARQCVSRASQLRANDALGSPVEKSRDLLVEEVNVLASLDR